MFCVQAFEFFETNIHAKYRMHKNVLSDLKRKAIVESSFNILQLVNIMRKMFMLFSN